MRFCVYLIVMMLALFSTAQAGAVETPATALTNIQRAIDGNDQVLLEKYIDLRGIITRGVDVFVADFAAHPPSGEGDPLLEMLSGGLSDKSGTAANQSMKIMLIEETRKFVIRGVASGDFSGRPSTQVNLPDGGLLSVLFADASTARKELRAVRVQPPQGEMTTASAKMYDHGSERSYPVQLELKRQPQGYWKVTEVSNISELIRIVRKEAEAR